MRWAALNVIVKAFKAAVPISFLASVLGFTVAESALSAPLSSSVASAAYSSHLQIGVDATMILPGCRTATFLGKSGAANSEQEGVKECGLWLVAHGAVVEEAKGVAEGESDEQWEVP
jgi:hypothetical protein